MTQRGKLATVHLSSGRALMRYMPWDHFLEQAMTKIVVLLIGLALTGVAQAQIKCWTTADGKRACGDAPPPGAKVRMLKGTSASSEEAPAAKGGAATDAKKGPQTAAEREQDYRKRQAEAQKSAAKADQQKQDNDARKENCERSQEMLRTLESGQRIQRSDSKGERYYLDDAQRDQEAAKARAQVQQNCG